MRKRKQHNWGGDDCPMWKAYLVAVRAHLPGAGASHSLWVYRDFLMAELELA